MAKPALKAHQINYSTFIYFDSNTNGSSGRPVFIDPKLIVRFMDVIDISQDSGKVVARAISTKLKAIAGGATSDSNLSNAAQHRDYFVRHHVYVTYTILQGGGADKGSGVYITDIQPAFESEKAGGPGLYKATYHSARGDDWLAKESNDKSLTTQVGALGALQPNTDASSDLDGCANAVGKYLERSDLKRIQDGFSLFYTPSYTIDQYGVWIGAEQKNGKAKGSPKALAQLMLNTENHFWAQTDNRYRWYVFGDGAKHLIKTLQQYRSQQQHPLGRHHEFIFIDPKAPLGELKAALEQVGVTLTADMIKVGASLASKAHIATDSQNTFANLHHNAASERKLNTILSAAKQHYAKRTRNVYFSDIVGSLGASLNKGWT